MNPLDADGVGRIHMCLYVKWKVIYIDDLLY